MKKIFLMLLLASIGFVANAQEKSVNSSPLQGIWQQEFSVVKDGKMATVPTGVFKIFNKDGSFLIFVIKDKTIVTVEGTYAENGEKGEYEETVSKHLLTPAMTGTTSKLRYDIKPEGLMIMKYYNDAVKEWVPEFWRRIPIEQ